MPIEVRWADQEQTIVQMTIDPQPSWSEFDEAVEQTVQLAKRVSHPVFVVLQPNNVPMPRNDNPIPHMQRVFRVLPENVKLFIIIMDKSGIFERSIINVVGRFAMGQKLRAVSQAEDAYQMIANQSARV